MGNVNIFEEYHSFTQGVEGPEIYADKELAKKAAKGKSEVTAIYKAITTYQLVDVVFGTGEVVEEVFKDVTQKGIYKIKEV